MSPEDLEEPEGPARVTLESRCRTCGHTYRDHTLRGGDLVPCIGCGCRCFAPPR